MVGWGLGVGGLAAEGFEGEGQRAAAAGEPGCWLKDREPEKPRSRTAASRGLGPAQI